MVFPLLGFDHNIINTVFDLTVDHIMEHGHHCSLISGLDVFKAKWHDGVVEVPNRCAEGGLFSIFGDMSI